MFEINFVQSYEKKMTLASANVIFFSFSFQFSLYNCSLSVVLNAVLQDNQLTVTEHLCDLYFVTLYVLNTFRIFAQTSLYAEALRALGNQLDYTTLGDYSLTGRNEPKLGNTL